MYKLFFTNIPDRGLVGEFASLEDAMAAGRQFSFELSITHNGDLVASRSTFSGWRMLPS